MGFADLVSISTFRSTADAQIAKGVLDEAGIESMMRADNAGGMYALSMLSSNTHDRSLEAAMTGAFVFGPLAALAAFVVGAVRAKPPTETE